MANKGSEYTSSKIQVLEGLNAVRMRPGMYIGSTGSKGLHHLLWEIVDNSIDELANGYGTKIIVTLHKDGSASVFDNGRGIPVDIHKDLKVSGVEVVFTQLHAGGKFSGENYNFSGGLHGVGASVTNALSEWCEVRVYKEWKEHFIRFSPKQLEGGDGKKPKIQYGAAEAPLKVVGKTDKQGTYVRFMPARDMFKGSTLSYETVAKRLRELAFLNKGIEIIFIDERIDENNEEGLLPKTEFKYDGGLSDFVTYLNEGKSPIYAKPFLVEGATQNAQVAFAIQHTDSYSDSVFSYVNNIPTSEGGTHETGFKMAITRAFNQIGKTTGILKDKDTALLGEDYREGMTAVLAIKMRDVIFEGQTKAKLGNPEAKTEVEQFTYANLIEFFKNPDSKKKALLESIINKAKGAARVREAARRAKEISRAKNQLDGGVLIGKLSACTGKRPELNELFIVEGDSAGGTAKVARDRSIQAILPLRGKPLNAEKKRLDQVLENEEFRTIISALGTSIGEDFQLENLKYHKVIIMADADQDGAHIRAILLTFLFRYMKELITEGHVYIGMPPLYKLYRKDFSAYAYNDEELRELTKTQRGTVQRYKGLGEMNADQLWETTMDPNSRKLCLVTLDDAAEAEKLITTLMGDNIDLRKEYISKHANFNKIEGYAAKAVKQKIEEPK